MEDGTDAVEVRAKVVVLVLDDFGSHVVGAAAVTVGVVGLGEVALTKSKVANVKMAIDVHKDVLGLC